MKKSNTLKNKTLWEDLAQLDPLYAVLSDGRKKYNKWVIKEFFQTGEIECKDVLSYLGSKNVGITFKNILDFGCGVGRLVNSFSKCCNFYYGIDSSPAMLKLARRFNKNCALGTF